jgi:hypothetical protein
MGSRCLNDIIVMLCRGRGSVARLVQNSMEVRRVFVGFVQTTKGAVKTVVANMRAAGHRFESMQKPLGRSCFHIHACIKTALHIMRARTDDSSKRAKAWLTWINSEKCLLAAMMADASDQTLMFTRILDNEQMDPAILASEVHSYMASITTLFGDQAKCLTVFGYTSVMLETLRTPVIWQIGNVIHSVGLSGGVPDETIQRCLDRMRSWVLLATAIVASEFPSFEVAQASSLSCIRIFILLFLVNCNQPGETSQCRLLFIHFLRSSEIPARRFRCLTCRAAQMQMLTSIWNGLPKFLASTPRPSRRSGKMFFLGLG